MTLIVCSLSDMPQVVRQRAASHLLTLIDPDLPVERPLGMLESRHLRLECDDIERPIEGYQAPAAELVIRLLDFGRDWDAAAPMVVHCYAGVSRSTASAFAIACARNPDIDEGRIARSLRQAASHALPNRRIVALADDILSRQGRMVDAIDAIGDSGVIGGGRPFDLPVRY